MHTRKGVQARFTLWAVYMFCLLSATLAARAGGQEYVQFPDPALEGVIRKALQLPSGPIPAALLSEKLTKLEARRAGVKDLTGLEACTNLEQLSLPYSKVRDVAPLARLPRLTTINLQNNYISEIKPFANKKRFPALKQLNLFSNPLNQESLCDYLVRVSNRLSKFKYTGVCGEDYDGDGLDTSYERQIGTSPARVDTDGDGLWDGDEILKYGTNPIGDDTDSDILLDGREIALGLNPLDNDDVKDDDHDGVSNAREYFHNTDPFDPKSVPERSAIQVLPTVYQLTPELPWSEFRIQNEGQLFLKWHIERDFKGLWVTKLPPLAPDSMKDFKLWGETLDGQGALTLYAGTTNFSKERTAVLTIVNDADKSDKLSLVFHIQGKNAQHAGLK